MLSPFHSLSQLPVRSPERLQGGPCWLHPVSFLISRPLCPSSSEHLCMLSHFSRVWLFAPYGLYPPGSSVHGDFQARILECVAMPSAKGSSQPRDLTQVFNPGLQPRSSTLWADSLLSEPPRKPKNTGVGSLSLLQGIFLTQESNPTKNSHTKTKRKKKNKDQKKPPNKQSPCTRRLFSIAAFIRIGNQKTVA